MAKASLMMLVVLPLLAIVGTADAAGCGILPDRADIQEKLHMLTAGEESLLIDTCSLCKLAVGFLTGEVKEGKSTEEIAHNIIHLACNSTPVTKHFPPDVCAGMVNISASPVLYILNYTTLDHAQVCNTFAGYCSEAIPSWTIPIPGDKPPVTPRIPNKGPTKIKILQISTLTMILCTLLDPSRTACIQDVAGTHTRTPSLRIPSMRDTGAILPVAQVATRPSGPWKLRYRLLLSSSQI